MTVFSLDAFDNHEQVAFCSDEETGLRAIIAVHSTALGQAVGGCRMWKYESEEDAIRDVLRLSRGMSYKNAMAGLPLGGGKSVIIGDARKDKTPELMQAFGRAVDRLGGRYITAEDVGISPSDMAEVAKVTDHVAGLDEGEAAVGDPSPYTAHGTFAGIQASVEHKLGKDSLEGLTVAVQGLGHVGYYLCKELHEAGAKLKVADINQDSVNRVVSEFGAEAVDVGGIHKTDAEIFAPCALGAILNDESIPELQCEIVAGAANNQLRHIRHDKMLHDKGILYAPDYVINAAGIIIVNNEIQGIAKTREEGMKDVEVIHDTLLEIYTEADKRNEPTAAIADALAEERIKKAQQERDAARKG